MKVELDKKDLISLARGVAPNYGIMNHYKIKEHGSYTGGFKDEWNWDYGAFENCTEQEIYEIYLMCKNSWEKI